jgi:hypothetical protein
MSLGLAIEVISSPRGKWCGEINMRVKFSLAAMLHKKTHSSYLAALLLVGGFVASPIGNALAFTCDGTCGTSSSADGVVNTPPTGGSYRWISTSGSTNGDTGFPGTAALPNVPITDGSAGPTNGTLYTTDSFNVLPGTSTKLDYYFKYVTSDGQTPGGGNFVFQDYAYAQLRDLGTQIITTLMTARTEPSGSIIPGVDLPPINLLVALTPSSVPIIDTGYTAGDANNPSIGPVWSPLGGSSGTCYGPGCGYTDWVHSTYTITNPGPDILTFVLLFGATNWADTAFDSGLAFSGLTINGAPIGGEDDISATPLPGALPLFATGLGALGLLGWRRKKKVAATAA